MTETIGISMDLDTLLAAGSDDELRDAIRQINVTLAVRDQKRKETALSEAKRLLKAAGVNAKIGKKKERK